MVTAMILSGGVGERVGGTVPKQYIRVCGKPVLMYCLETFAKSALIDEVIVVAQPQWHSRINAWIRDAKISKFAGFAEAGNSREGSVYRGLQYMKKRGAQERDVVLVHDAVRPCLSNALLENCIRALEGADGVLPVIAVADTIYQSTDGCGITGLLDRDALYAGQNPECFCFGRYYAAHQGMTQERLDSIRGSSILAYEAGMKIRLIPGEACNYKITTEEDLKRFQYQTEYRAGGSWNAAE